MCYPNCPQSLIRALFPNFLMLWPSVSRERPVDIVPRRPPLCNLVQSSSVQGKKASWASQGPLPTPHLSLLPSPCPHQALATLGVHWDQIFSACPDSRFSAVVSKEKISRDYFSGVCWHPAAAAAAQCGSACSAVIPQEGERKGRKWEKLFFNQ